MSKMGHGIRARNLPRDVQRWAASGDGTQCMMAAQLRKRRLEGYRQHAEGVRMVTVSSMDELETLFGVRGAGFKSLAFEVDAFFNVLDDITQPVESDVALRNRTRIAHHNYWPKADFTLLELEGAYGRGLDVLARKYGLVRG